MASYGIIQALAGLEELYDPQRSAVYLQEGYYHPGYLAVLTAFAHSRRVQQNELFIPKELQGYFSAIGIPAALWGDDTYTQGRINHGRNYSMMTHLSNEAAVDTATSQINSCIRQMVEDYADVPAVNELQQVVGELHDNVWSHGKASGFSMAQKWQVPLTNDYYLEFSLADCGIGFLEETNRASLGFRTHAEAIEWCIQEGHSTKHGDDIDPFAQRLPNGFIGNSPYGGAVPTREGDNHHQGLGLAKLVQLVTKNSGELYIATGDTYFYLNSQGVRNTVKLDYEWPGVAISCRLRESELRASGNEAIAEGLTLELMDQLRA